MHMTKSIKNKNKNHICINNKDKKKYKAWFNIFKNSKKYIFVDIFACIFRFNNQFIKVMRTWSTFQKHQKVYDVFF